MIRAVAALAAAVAAAAAPHGAGKRPAMPAVVRAGVVSGSGQQARAYVASNVSKYIAEFPKPLVARVSGPPPERGDRIIVFRCTTPGCTFVSAEQPNEGKYVDRVGAVYKVTVVNGRATLRVSLAGDSPAARYTVTAQASPRGGERAVPASFTLVMR
jgi:hypothetical protein